MKIDGREAWCAAALCFAVVVAIPGSMLGQAWIDPKGETSISLTYQFSDFLGHTDQTGKAHAEQGSQAQLMTLELEYSVSDRLAISASLPYTLSRLGSNPAPKFTDFTGINDGNYHGTWQDYGLELRYNVLARPLVVTPFLSFVVPSHHYQTVAAEAVGRDLRETHVGLDAGRALDPLLPRVYVDAHVGYVFSQKTLGISTNKTIADVAAGYFVTPRFTARAIASYQKTHGGVTADQVFSPTPVLPPDVLHGHDRLLRDTHLRAGVAGSLSVGPRTDLYAGYVKTPVGEK